MNNLNESKKTPIEDITKDVLIDLYFNKKMSLNDIGKHFGYYDRQPITRLFKKFDIEIKNKSQASKDKQSDRYVFPTVEELKELLKTNSVLKLSKTLNIPRGTLNKYMIDNKIYNDYFKNNDLKEKLNSIMYGDMSPKEISLTLGVDIQSIKYHKKDYKERIYSINEIKDKFEKYNYDTDNQGLVKQIQSDDNNLFNSVIFLTKDHLLESNKFTERLYRLFNNYSHDKIEKCKFCQNNLKFYTFKLGYGNSINDICKNCIPNHCGFGVSKISQQLFSDIYNNINDSMKTNCKYHDLNGEFIISITPDDHFNLKEYNGYLNHHKYHIDFVCNNKIIEFDGVYWHDNSKKDFAKDEFLKHKGYQVLRVPELEYYKDKNKILEQCLTFLNQ